MGLYSITAPTVKRKEGFEFLIYTKDHPPAHVHVWKAGDEVLFNLSDERNPVVGELLAFQVARKAVVFTLGLNSDKPGSVVDLVMKQLRPEFVGFLGSPATDAAGIVLNLSRILSLPAEKVKSESWEPTAIREGRIKTLLVLDWLMEKGLAVHDIVIDLTGGTATMSVAAFMAAEERAVDCQYIYSEWDRDKDQLKRGTQRPILITRYAELNAATERGRV